ncbi:class II glutamine amidotransferase [Microbacterium sp. H1-D42]|uniref:class II glutamine amidotransferase n=1 Tax=Microbacterium sp. H1-D42 TaxID=2925844 RepID=UPI001F536828|nr:class II glutamine amidotransferase [Microbacterium sp. H1-D42]UNK69978.1 class II glutamine amidotransferase [Microbacterium sp. H1-D42]
MCRLFAFVSPVASTARSQLHLDGLESLLSLARLHGDGWGWAGVETLGAAPEVRKSPLSAVSDADFTAAIDAPARAAMVHLRWATAGLPVNMNNAHPFDVDGITFGHNGTIKPLDELRALLSPASASALTGTTDSEMYFALIREQVALGSSLHDATVAVVRMLREKFPQVSLNALMLDGEQLIVVHASATSALNDDDLGRMGPLADSLPPGHNEDYFALRWREGVDGTVAVSSTGVAGDGWQPLPAESVTAIRLDDRSRTTIELTPAAIAQG